VNAELRDLYQNVILDHYKKPRNFRKLEGADRSAEGYNPLCGDRVIVFLRLEGDVVKEVTFVGSGCAICTASASLLTERLKGKTRAEAETLFRRFHELVAGEGEPGESDEGPELGKLEVFAGVREFPLRVKCATLPWHTFRAALACDGQAVSTE
jgi:nitrogen fixation NifU-like protein